MPGGFLHNNGWPVLPDPFSALPPVNVTVGAQPAPPPESAASKIMWAILLGAVPSILAGLVLYYATREKKEAA
jgi:uncharacterized protein involved in exopolysaccharide biosynthesis